MKKLALALATFLVMGMSSLVALTLTASSADAASCFKTVSVTGTNAYGYAKPYSWNDWKKFVRTAPTATICINYSRARGGYYVFSATCNQSSARLTGDATSFQRGSNWVQGWSGTHLTCGASATWKWHRTVGNEQCTSLTSYTQWNLNQANGVVSFGGGSPVDGYFRPASSC